MPIPERISAVCLSILWLLFSTGCEQAPPQAVKIGVVLPLTGDYQIYGTAGVRGAEMAVDEINANGGVLDGRPLKLIVTDNRTDPSESIRLARHLIQKEKVTALLGPVSSSARNAMLEEAREFRTPLLYGIDYEGGSFDRYLFCYSTIPDHYINPIMPHMLETYGKSVYIFGYDYIWPHQMAKAVERETRKLGGLVVGKEFTPFGVTDYSDSLKRIQDSGAKVLVLIQPGRDGFNFIRQFNAAGLRKDVRILAIAADESYLTAVRAADLEGIHTALHFFASLDSDKARNFVGRFKSRYGDDAVPTYAAESHYGLIRLLASAITKAGSLDRDRIIDAMENTTLESGGGRAQVRADHHFDLPMFLARFTDGQLLVEKSLGVISPPDQRHLR